MILHTHRIPARAEQRRLLVAFMDAAKKDKAAALEELFAADIVSYSDGASRAHLPQWRSRIPRDHNRHNTRHRPDHVDNEAEQAHSCFHICRHAHWSKRAAPQSPDFPLSLSLFSRVTNRPAVR